MAGEILTRQMSKKVNKLANISLLFLLSHSVESDLPMQQLSELFNVNHFIVSQVCLLINMACVFYSSQFGDV